MTDMNELFKDAKEELHDWYMKERPGRNDIDNMIDEIAESQVPIYTGDLYDCLSTCYSLGENTKGIDFNHNRFDFI